MIGEGDKVVARLVATATNTGPFAGQPATGKKVEIRSIRIYRIADNKIVETWAMQDRLGLMEQLGFVQSAGGVNWASGQEE
jgi:predicted ester cyclase